MTSAAANATTRARRIVGVNASEDICTAALERLQRLKSMRAPSASRLLVLQPLQRSNRCAPPPASRFFCSDTRDAMPHSAFPSFCTRLHTRARLFNAATRSSPLCCNRPHGWKAVALRCRRSPRSELELFYAQNELKVLASPSQFILVRTGAKRARARLQELKRYARGRQKYREESCERTIASRVE